MINVLRYAGNTGERDCHGSDAHIKHDHYFDSIEQIDEYTKKRFSRKSKK